MPDLDNLTPARYRERYEALQQAARVRAAAAAAPPSVAEIANAGIIRSDTIPPGNYVALRLKRGRAIRITNPAGTPGAALLLWNADETSERYNAGDTTKLQWTTNLTTGRVLFSDMGRVLAAITADSGAGHDSIIGPNSPAQADTGRNGRDNLRLAAAKFGLTRRDIAPALSLFSPIATDADGRFSWRGNPPAGAMVELRAEMNLLVALSNTPHALSPVTQATGPIHYTVYEAGSAGADFCRGFTQEAAAGFANTEDFYVS